MYFCECLNDNNLFSILIYEIIKFVLLDDIEWIMKLWSDIVEFLIINELEKILR